MAKKNVKRFGAFQSEELNAPAKALLDNIRFAGLDKPIKTIVITSSVVDEGKSTLSSNLSCAMANSGKRTLVVDADLRRRSLGSMLGMHGKYGLYSVLAGQASLQDAIVQTKISNLFFLDCERNVANPADVFSTKRFASLVNKLSQSFDYVVFDMPPVGLFVDAAVASNLVDGVLLAVRQNSTKRNMVDKSIQQLRSANANILGIVMTFCSTNEDNDYYSYYSNEDGSRKKGSSRPQAMLSFDESKFASSSPNDKFGDFTTGNKSAADRSKVAVPNPAGAKSASSGSDEGLFAPGGFLSGNAAGGDPSATTAVKSRARHGSR